MKIRIHENGWTVIAEDIDLKNITKQEADTIAYYLAKNTVVVVKGQRDLIPADEVRVCGMIGKLEDFTHFLEYPKVKHLIVKDSDNKVLRVTGELDEHGQPGLFGHVSDLDWHANQTANEFRHPIVWLYGVKGTEGSRTSWVNNILSYNDLSEEDKEYYKTIKMINGYKQGSYSEDVYTKSVDINYTYTPNIVHTNIVGETGLFFPFLQIHQIVGMTEEQSKEFIIKLRDHILQEKYMYHHDWEDGDVLLHEQWLGIHKRWRFENMATRVLHRITFDFANADFNNIQGN